MARLVTWEPIRSAPKDGKIIGLRGGTLGGGRMSKRGVEPGDLGAELCRWTGSGWVAYGYGEPVAYLNPTEWLKIVQD